MIFFLSFAGVFVSIFFSHFESHFFKIKMRSPEANIDVWIDLKAHSVQTRL